MLREGRHMFRLGCVASSCNLCYSEAESCFSILWFSTLLFASLTTSQACHLCGSIVNTQCLFFCLYINLSSSHLPLCLHFLLLKIVLMCHTSKTCVWQRPSKMNPDLNHPKCKSKLRSRNINQGLNQYE